MVITDPELLEILWNLKQGLICREAALKHFGISRDDIRQAIQNIELISRIHAARN